MSWYRGTTLGECIEDGDFVPCRGSQRDVYRRGAFGNHERRASELGGGACACALPRHLRHQLRATVADLQSRKRGGLYDSRRTAGRNADPVSTEAMGSGPGTSSWTPTSRTIATRPKTLTMWSSNPTASYSLRRRQDSAEPGLEPRGRADRLPTAQTSGRSAGRARGPNAGPVNSRKVPRTSARRVVPRVPDRPPKPSTESATSSDGGHPQGLTLG